MDYYFLHYAELQKLRRDYEQQVRAAQRLKNEQREDRKKHLNQVGGLLEDLCKAYTELEEIKVSATSLHPTVQYYQVLLLVAYHKPFE